MASYYLDENGRRVPTQGTRRGGVSSVAPVQVFQPSGEVASVPTTQGGTRGRAPSMRPGTFLPSMAAQNTPAEASGGAASPVAGMTERATGVFVPEGQPIAVDGRRFLGMVPGAQSADVFDSAARDYNQVQLRNAQNMVPQTPSFGMTNGTAQFLGSRSMASNPAFDRASMEAQFGRPGQTVGQNQQTMAQARGRLDEFYGRTQTPAQAMQSQEQMAKYGMLAEMYKGSVAKGEDPNKAAMDAIGKFFEGGGTVEDLPKVVAALGMNPEDSNRNGVPDKEEEIYQNALLAEQRYGGKEANLTGEQLANLNKARVFRKNYEKKYAESLNLQ